MKSENWLKTEVTASAVGSSAGAVAASTTGVGAGTGAASIIGAAEALVDLDAVVLGVVVVVVLVAFAIIH